MVNYCYNNLIISNLNNEKSKEEFKKFINFFFEEKNGVYEKKILFLLLK